MTINDPENYRKMSEPFATAEEGNAAIDSFFVELRALRNKHRLADVLMVVSISMSYEAGEGRAITQSMHGDALKAEGMAACSLGRLQEERREIINQMMAGKRSKR